MTIWTSGAAEAQQYGRQSAGLADVYLSIGVGLATYKSEAVQSNDTNVTSGYTLGFSGGPERELIFALTNESSTTSFTYANSTSTSSIATTFQDTLMAYRWGFIYLGLVFSQTQILASNLDTDYMDSLATGQGFAFGARVPVRKSAYIILDYLSSNTTVTKDVVQSSGTETTLGARSDVFLGGLIAITKSLLKARIGYRQRTFAMTVAGSSSTELQTMTWIGLDFNLFL